MADTDDLTTALDQIKADHEAANAFGANASDPVPRLVAAVEAVLAKAVEWKQIPFSVRASDECADELREAITEALAKWETP